MLDGLSCLNATIHEMKYTLFENAHKDQPHRPIATIR
jgi:hypothetical protein